MKHSGMKITQSRFIWEEENCSYLYHFLSLCSIPVRNPKSHLLLRMEERVKDTDDQSIHTFITNYSIYVQTVTNLRSYHISLTVSTVNTIYNLQRTRSHRSPVMHVAKPTTNSQMDKLRYGEFTSLKTMTVAETRAEASYAECHSLIISQTPYGQVMSHNKQALYF